MGHSVHFAKFPDVQINFQKATPPQVFFQFQPNFMESMVTGGEYRPIFFFFFFFFFEDLPKKKHFKFFNTGPFNNWVGNFKMLLLELSSDLMQTS